MSFQKPPKLFIAYAHEDEKLKNELTKRLELLKRRNEIEVWHDGELKPGDKWQEVRDRYLKNANVVLYLVSTDSLLSDECNKEIASALDNQKRFVPIILRECDWKRHKIGESSITDLQALPKDGKPINSQKNKDKAWQDVIDGLRNIFDSEKEQEDTLQSTLFELGNAKYMLGALDKAQVAYTKAIDLDPKHVQAYYNRGLLFSNLNQYDKALEDYNKAIDIDPNHARIYNNRGGILRELGQYDKAKVDFDKAIDLDPKHVQAYYNRGLLFSNLNQYDKALEDYNKAIDIDPNHARIYNNRGGILCELGQYDKAKEDFDKVIDLDPKHVQAYYNRGLLFSNLNQYDKALADYTKAINIDPNQTIIYNNRGGILRELGQYDKAKVDFDKAIDLDPSHIQAYYNRGLLFSNLHQYDKAKADFDKVIDIDPKHVQAYYNRGLLFSNLNQYDKALEDYNKAIDINPNHARIYNNRGGILCELGQYDKAKVDFDKAIDLDPSHIQAYYNRGNLLSELGQYDKALADYNKAIDIDPNHAIIYNNRGGILRELGQYDKALADYNKAIDLDLNHVQAYYNRGNLLSELEQYDKALADYNKVIELDPNHAIIYYNRGNLLYKLQRYNEAVADVKKAKELSQQEGNQKGVVVCERWLNKNRPSSDSSIKPLKGRGSLLTGRNKSNEERILEVMYDLHLPLEGCRAQLSANSEQIDNTQRLVGALARTCSIFLRKMVIGDRGNKETRLLNDEILQSSGLKFSKIIKIPEKRKALDALNLSFSGGSTIFKEINETTRFPESSYYSPISPMECKISIDWPLPGVANWTENPTEENMWCIQEEELFDTQNNDVFDCDQWLGQQLVIFDDKGITLKEVIKTVANYEGAHASNVFHLSQPESDKKNYSPANRPDLHILNNIKFFEAKYSHIVVIESALYLYEKLMKNDLCKNIRGDAYKATICFASPSPEDTFLEYSKWLRYDGNIMLTFGNEKDIISHWIRAVN